MSYLRRGKRTEPLRSRADLKSPAALTDELDLIVSVLTGYPKSMARADALRAVDSIRRLLAAMWADHAEVPKSLLKEAAIELAADDNRNEYDSRKVSGNSDAPLQDR